MNFGILHLEKPELALKEAHRVLRAGGSAGFTAWSTTDQARGFACVLEAINKHGDACVRLPDGPPFFRFSQFDEFERCLKDAGFARVDFQRIKMQWRLNEGLDLFNAFHLGAPRTGGLLRAQPEANLERIKAEVVESSREFLHNDELIVPMESILAIAKKAKF
jgi:ubiquinone/menaquinone biosynthesis C-methylase UbiE